MVVLIKSHTSLKMGHVGSKTRSLCSILEKPCVCYRGNIFNPIIMKLGRNVCLDEISDKFNPFPNKPWFSRICSKNLSKTLWEKEKLLVMSNFSFYHSVFYHFGELSAISLNLKLLSANSFSFFFWERVKNRPCWVKN